MPKRYRSKSKKKVTKSRKLAKALTKPAVKRIIQDIAFAQACTGTCHARGVAGIKSFLLGAPNVASPNRQILFGRGNWLNRNVMFSIVQNCFSENPTGKEKFFIRRYIEYHTIQNTCLFPVVLTAYKYYFPATVSSIATGTVVASYGTAAAENTAALGGNTTDNTATAANHPSFPVMMIFRDNVLHNCGLPAYAADADRSQVREDSGLDMNVSVYGTLSRPFGCIRVFNPGKEMKIRKVKTVTLLPGQQITYRMHKRNKWIPADAMFTTDGVGDNDITYWKGAEGFLFEAHGLLSHDNGGAAVLDSLYRSSFTLGVETGYNVSMKRLDVSTTYYNRSLDIDAPNAITGAEVRAGMEVEETLIT